MSTPNSCLSVRQSARTPKNHPIYIKTSPTLVIDTSMKTLHKYYSMNTQTFDFFFKGLYSIMNCILTCAE